MQGMRSIPGTIDIKQDWENKILKIEVQIDQSQARRAGVTSQEVANSLNAFIDGVHATDYREGDTTIPVVLRGVAIERNNVANLRSISIYSALTNGNVPLSQIASFNPVWEYSRIKRLNQERTITISAKHQFLTAGELVATLQANGYLDVLADPLTCNFDLPPGYRCEIGGELENSSEAQQKLIKNMPICFAAIVLLLVWQFNSFRRPAIILMTIPLTFIGAVIGLLAMNAEFGFMVILGLLSLAGIIINNGIVLIDRIDTERAAGRDPYS